MRQEFVLGNILQDNMAVLNNLADLMRRRVHGLPASGYDECACCTRFCQLNASLTKLDNFLKAQQLSSEAIEAFLTAGKENS